MNKKSRLKDIEELVGTAPPDFLTAKISYTLAQAERVRLANQVTRKEMLPAAAVEREWAGALRDLRAALLAIPSRVQQRLPHLTAHDIATLDRDIRDTLTELAGDDDDLI